MLSTATPPILQVCQQLPLRSDEFTLINELFLELQHRDMPEDERLQQLAAAAGGYFMWSELDPKHLLQEATHEYFVKPLTEDQWLVITPGSQPLLHFISKTEHRKTPLSKSQLKKCLGAKAQRTEKDFHWLQFIPTQTVTKTSKKTPFQRLLAILRVERLDLRLIFLYSVMLGILELGIPVTMQALVNNVAFGIFTEPVFVLTLLLLTGLGIMGLIKTFRLIIVEMLERRLYLQVAQEVTQKLVNVSLAKYSGRKLPELVNRFLDVVTVQKSASFLLIEGLTLILQTFAGLTLLAFYHPYLFVFDLFLISAMAFVLFALGWGAVDTSLKESTEKYATVAWLEEIAEHNTLFKPTLGYQYAMHRTRRVVQSYLQARAKHFQVLLRQNIGAFALQAIASASLLGLGGWLVVKQEITMGQLVAAELIVAGVVNSFSKIGKHLESYYDLLAAIDKIGYLFDLPQETQRINLLSESNPRGLSIDFEKVSSPSGLTQLQDFNFHIQSGEKIALMGPLTPTVKYFFDLLDGTYPPEKGWVKINGTPIHHYRLNDYRSQVVHINQLEIVQDTILNNLRLGAPHLTRQEAQTLLEKTGLWHVVQDLPLLLDTPLAAQGQPFSQPQAYRLVLARALAMKPRLLILDRILDATEWQEEGPISQWLNSEPETTVILLTQILPLAQCFDRVLCFDSQTGELVDYTENGGSTK